MEQGICCLNNTIAAHSPFFLRRAWDTSRHIERVSEKVTLVQIDAHADLRDELDGEPYSHACAIARSAG